MSKLSSLPRMSREDLPGAPDWVDQLLQVSNEFQEQATQRINQDLLTGVFEDYKFVHGVEQVIKNPFGNSIPRGISNVRCQGLEVDSAGKTTGKLYDLEVDTVKWRPVQTRPGQPQRIGVTVKYVPLSTSGYVGEAARSFLSFGSRNALVNATPETITSIAMTAGDWDVSAICGFGGAALTGTALYAGISPTTNVLPSDYGDNIWDTGLMPTANASSYIVIPSYRVSLSVSATYYMVAQANFTAGSTGAFGRISATRVKPYSTGLTGRVTLRFDGGN